MTRAGFDGPITWSHCRINGRMTSSCDVGSRRLYVCKRFGAIEAWVDQTKLGNFATMAQAKVACLKRVGAPLPVLPPKPITQPHVKPAEHHEPRLAKGARFGDPKHRRPEEEIKLASFPVADLSQPAAPDVIIMVQPEPMRPAIDAPVVRPPLCKCGAQLGRSGQCPALCQPLPQPLPVYTGPKIVGSTHIGKLAQPVTGWIG